MKKEIEREKDRDNDMHACMCLLRTMRESLLNILL